VKYLFNNTQSTAPVEAGESYDVTIEDIAREGDGIARVSGFVVFVPETKVGDEVTIKVTKVLSKFAFGELA
jgi:predicted RNA-binding protein with TRAM domain